MKTKKFDYRVEYRKGTNDMLKELLEDFGPQGWELCGTVSTPDIPNDLSSAWPGVVRYYFKRERKT